MMLAESAWDIPFLNRKIVLFHYYIFKLDLSLYITLKYIDITSIVKLNFDKLTINQGKTLQGLFDWIRQYYLIKGFYNTYYKLNNH